MTKRKHKKNRAKYARDEFQRRCDSALEQLIRETEERQRSEEEAAVQIDEAFAEPFLEKMRQKLGIEEQKG